MRRQLALFFISFILCSPLIFAVNFNLSDLERAKVIVARHLLGLIGKPTLSSLVSQRTIKTDSYWSGVFKDAHQPSLYPLIRTDLMKAMDEVPLVGGRLAKPDVFAKAVLRGLSPFPIVPLRSLPEEEQNRVLSFSQGALKRFASKIYSTSSDFDEAIADVALDAGSTFRSPAISEGFNRLGDLSTDVRMKEQELELVDAKDRLNEYLHLWGLHLVLNQEQLEEGKLNLSAYVIDQKFVYDILRTSFVLYQAQPLIEHEFYPALGHAETEQGYLFLFGQTIDQEVEMTSRYLSDASSSFLKPSVTLSTPTVQAIDALVRNAIVEKNNLRARFIDTIGHHEGFHKYIDATLTESVRRGWISFRNKSVWHETGAYLYQLETSDPRFTALDLMVILATAINIEPGFYGNKEGARQVFVRLQQELPKMRFVGSSGEWMPEGLIELFKISPEVIKDSAERARMRYEVEARNGGK